jgi:hypothetical protein
MLLSRSLAYYRCRLDARWYRIVVAVFSHTCKLLRNAEKEGSGDWMSMETRIGVKGGDFIS